MFGLGMGEVVIILVLALILLGPQKLPDAAKQLGKGLREFRKATDDLKSQFETELYAEPSKPQKPTLVEPAKPAAEGEPPPVVPPGGVPAQATGEVPAASAQNVPGLELALAEPRPAAPVVEAAPAPAPAAEAAPKVS
jgi:sec-independent protein translocase protein TatB